MLDKPSRRPLDHVTKVSMTGNPADIPNSLKQCLRSTRWFWVMLAKHMEFLSSHGKASDKLRSKDSLQS